MTDPASPWLHGHPPVPPRLTHIEEVMGTVVTFDVQLESFDAGERDEAQRAILAAAAWLHQVDATYSTYRADSVVSRLARGEVDRADCPAEVRHTIELCEEFRDRTGGWFDPWAGPHGFDPSGLVKGWSAQLASDLLVERGFVRHCINAGGDVAVRGNPADAPSWGVAIVDPFDRLRVLVAIGCVDCAVATSGIAERGHHVWRPVDGLPASDLASVTVVHEDLTTADVFATVALAMGNEATGWLSAQALDALVVGIDGSEWCAAGFRDRILDPWG